MLLELKHKNIINFQNFYMGENKCFLWFDYVPMDLKKYLDRLPADVNLTRTETKSYLYQITSAIDYCHQRRINHGNLCPQNILISQKGVIKVKK